MLRRLICAGWVLVAGVVAPGCAVDPHPHGHHDASAPATAASVAMTTSDGRELVRYPDAMRLHTLANMRDHLRTIGDIQAALARGAFDDASQLAEGRLGMTSLALHGAHALERYMPAGMQAAGAAMHRAASRFSVVAKDASVTGDLKAALGSLAALSQTCVACHDAYRLQ